LLLLLLLLLLLAVADMLLVVPVTLQYFSCGVCWLVAIGIVSQLL
jgi:hypothetical protein